MTLELSLETLSWRNDPKVLRWNRNHKPIELDEHVAWFENRQSTKATEPLFSYHFGEIFIGTARLDQVSVNTFEVSLIINPSHRGMGFGRIILGDACSWFSSNTKDSKLIATIHMENKASQKLFESLDFSFLSQDKDFRTYSYFGI